MWFFIAVIVLYGTTAYLGRQDSAVLPSLVQWGWWAVALYACGLTANLTTFLTLTDRMAGLFGYTLFLVYYMTQSATYTKFVPTDSANPELWPTVFVAVNLIGPVILVSVGCIGVAVQKGR